jgi:CRISPR system Cascade subunit CasC
MNSLNKKIEFHILQSFPVSCLNRDDVGSPKSAVIGGVNRARVSSQCWKRQVRQTMHELGINLGIRTKNIEALLNKAFLNAGANTESAEASAKSIAGALAKDTLIFVSENDLNILSEYASEKGFDFKDTDEKTILKDISKLFKGMAVKNKALNGIDIALFGRMVAATKEMNVEASASFSHAISTHQVSTDIDYFTALDDMQEDDDQGASHIGTNEFNAATYYRYICLDINTLASNLGITDIETDRADVEKAIETFVKALVIAVPTARQTTMSAASSWDYAKVLIREGQPLQMNFDKPVRAKGEGFLKPSIEELNSQIDNRKKLLGSLYSSSAELEWGLDSNYSIDDLIKDIKAVI